MGNQGQKAKNWDTVAVDARVNGQRVARAPRSRGGDRLYRNGDIEWLLNQSRGELGEQGSNICPVKGGGDPSDNWPRIEQMHRAISAVERWRRLSAVMARLSPESQLLLRERYKATEREHSEIMGLRAAFSDLATLAWFLCEDRQSMRRKLSSGKSGGDRDVNQLRVLATATNRRIHVEWLDAEREMALEIKCPRRAAHD